VAGAPAAKGIQGTVLHEHVPSGEPGDSTRSVRVWLPPSYFTPEAAQRRYPVVYLLHGWPGSDNNWLASGHAPEVAESLAARGAIPEVILVFPSGKGPGLLGRSYWIDSFDGRCRLETWLTQRLVPWVDDRFRTRTGPADRGLIGLSDGANGAFDLALRHPDLFGAAAGHSSDYVLAKTFGGSGIYGPEPGASALLASHSPARYVGSVVDVAKRLRLYVDCGTGDGSLAATRAFHSLLDSLGVAHEYHEFPGSHTWGYWRLHLHESLVAVTSGMR
jgi:enterochelin esterase-like enzyme